MTLTACSACAARLLLNGIAAAIQPASASGVPIVSSSGDSFTPSFSGDGRFVVFVSQANNLVTNDNLAPYLDIFVRDLVNNRTALVSVNSSGVGGGDENSNFPTISSNGQFIAFESAASNLAGADTNGATDVFVRDVQTGTTTRVSADFFGREANGVSGIGSISADGRYVAFHSAASNLVAGDANGTFDIYVRAVVTPPARH